jgi:ATP-dependent protease HslVU (ClpYQ) peptidase subunit
MELDLSIKRATRAEQETETEANRLIEHVEGALAAVAVHSADAIESLEAIADRIERASHDLAMALRELAHERRISQNEAEQLHH